MGRIFFCAAEAPPRYSAPADTTMEGCCKARVSTSAPRRRIRQDVAPGNQRSGNPGRAKIAAVVAGRFQARIPTWRPEPCGRRQRQPQSTSISLLTSLAHLPRFHHVKPSRKRMGIDKAQIEHVPRGRQLRETHLDLKVVIVDDGRDAASAAARPGATFVFFSRDGGTLCMPMLWLSGCGT